MSWSQEQIAVVEGASFDEANVGYVREDVERLRLRALIAMRAGKPLPDLDAMVLRRSVRGGASIPQVDGLLTLLSVWKRTTPIESPADVARREREAELAAVIAETDATAPRWSHAQMDLVREKRFTLVPRRSTGYDENDVDDYLDEVVVAMRRGTALPDPAYARFGSSGLRRGYDPKEVDDFLDEIARMQPEA